MLAFLDYLRRFLVPRFQLAPILPSEMKGVYYDRVHAEHETIVRAIEQGVPAAVRRVMRDYVANNFERVRSFAASRTRPEGPRASRPASPSLPGWPGV